MEKNVAVPMHIVEVLLKPCCELRQDGVDEEHHQKTALGYAMQSAQNELVDKVGALKDLPSQGFASKPGRTSVVGM